MARRAWLSIELWESLGPIVESVKSNTPILEQPEACGANRPADPRDKVVNHREFTEADRLRRDKVLAQKGWAAPDWLREWGGTGGTSVQRELIPQMNRTTDLAFASWLRPSARTATSVRPKAPQQYGSQMGLLHQPQSWISSQARRLIRPVSREKISPTSICQPYFDRSAA